VVLSSDVTAIVYGNITGIDKSRVTEAGICYGTSDDPLTSNDHIVAGTCMTGTFSCNLTNLTPGITYFIRAYIIYSDGEKITLYGNVVIFNSETDKSPAGLTVIYNPDLNPEFSWGSVSDIDGNVYKTIQIGSQVWMAENLKTTRYNDGSQIPNITGNSVWVGLTTGAYRWYNNDASTYKNKYGALYNHYAVNTGKLCPTGWHVPGDEEWKVLEMALGMTKASADSSYLDFDVYSMGDRGTDQGAQMKAASGWSDWEGIYGNGTNTSGFSALPAGDTGWDGKCELKGICTSWWCFGDPWARCVGSGSSKVSRALYFNHIGFSVRCVEN
jgi:uncharacterized protein (TIGR02145 family)